MVACELVVSVRDDDEAGRGPGLPAQQPHNVQCAFIGPVRVLHDDDECLAGLRAAFEERRGDVVRSAPGAEGGPSEAALRALGDLEERPERARRGQRVAASPEDARARRQLVAEAPNQRRLADTRLAAHEDQAPVPCGGATEGLVELRECLVALDEGARQGSFHDRHRVDPCAILGGGQPLPTGAAPDRDTIVAERREGA